MRETMTKERLQRIRRLMLDENKNVTEASLEVGYESVSGRCLASPPRKI